MLSLHYNQPIKVINKSKDRDRVLGTRRPCFQPIQAITVSRSWLVVPSIEKNKQPIAFRSLIVSALDDVISITDLLMRKTDAGPRPLGVREGGPAGATEASAGVARRVRSPCVGRRRVDVGVVTAAAGAGLGVVSAEVSATSSSSSAAASSPASVDSSTNSTTISKVSVDAGVGVGVVVVGGGGGGGGGVVALGVVLGVVVGGGGGAGRTRVAVGFVVITGALFTRFIGFIPSIKKPSKTQ